MMGTMTSEEIQRAVQMIGQEQDTNVKQLLLAALVSELFREKGFEPVIVGGSAIEFYTEGAYMSGDVDICWAGVRSPMEMECAEIMRQIPGADTKGGRSWRVSGLWIDLLGDLNSLSNTGASKLPTPIGTVVLIAVEDLLAGRVFSARKWTGFNEEEDHCARKLMTAALSGSIRIDWQEAERIAASSKYDCAEELRAMRSEVEAELAKLKS